MDWVALHSSTRSLVWCWWERLIGLTKTSLKKVLGRIQINLEELQMVVPEIEAVLNDRPILYTSTDVGDLLPFTPAHFLYGRRITSLPHSEDIDGTADVCQTTPRDMAMRQTHIKHHFWERWKEEYLTALREKSIKLPGPTPRRLGWAMWSKYTMKPRGATGSWRWWRSYTRVVTGWCERPQSDQATDA